jgi:hypothetical protein
MEDGREGLLLAGIGASVLSGPLLDFGGDIILDIPEADDKLSLARR